MDALLPVCVGERFTRTLGLGPGLTRSEILRALKQVRARHDAVCGLIAALEAAGRAGCDLSYVQCLGCERLAAAREPRRRAG